MTERETEGPETRLLRAEIDRALDERERRLETPGGGDHTGGMDDWRQAVETRLAQLNQDFRWTWAALAVGFITVAGMLVTGYFRLDDKLDLLIP